MLKVVCRVAVTVSVIQGDVVGVREGMVSEGAGGEDKEGGVGRDGGGRRGGREGDRSGMAEREVGGGRRESRGGGERERRSRGGERGRRMDGEERRDSGRMGNGGRVTVVQGPESRGKKKVRHGMVSIVDRHLINDPIGSAAPKRRGGHRGKVGDVSRKQGSRSWRMCACFKRVRESDGEQISGVPNNV